MGYFDVAQVCLNGHVITRNAKRSPQFQKKFCDKCGAETIIACPECKTPIQGEYHAEGVFVLGSTMGPPPGFCHNCGRPYAWTQRRIEAATVLADELEDISSEEQETLKRSLDSLVRDSPETELAATRFKRIMAKVGAESYAVMKSILINVVSEAAKKTLYP